ncbi:phosphotriesterase family protein, partial [Streptomyces tendae]
VLDHVGAQDGDHVTDAERADLVADLVRAGHGDRVLLSSSATGVAKGHAGNDLPYGHVLTAFVPLLKNRGLGDEDTRRILVDNPRALLSVR